MSTQERFGTEEEPEGFTQNARWACLDCEKAGGVKGGYETSDMPYHEAHRHVMETGHRMKLVVDCTRIIRAITKPHPAFSGPRYRLLYTVRDVKAYGKCKECGLGWALIKPGEDTAEKLAMERHVLETGHSVDVRTEYEWGLLSRSERVTHDGRTIGEIATQATLPEIGEDAERELIERLNRDYPPLQPGDVLQGGPDGVAVPSYIEPAVQTLVDETLRDISHEITTLDHIHLRAIKRAMAEMLTAYAGAAANVGERYAELIGSEPPIESARLALVVSKFMAAYGRRVARLIEEEGM